MSALAGLLREDHWPGFSLHHSRTVGGLCNLGVLAVAGLFVGENIISWVRVPALAQLKAGVHSSLS